ncbi:MAG TPA: DNA polymerase III subunit gamma/tau [Actinomycetota bacterium]|nr:DNA polymerase III subunit gamma/tau [Actinomycetota bacterium]
MAHVSLYRKYRPQKFADILGQDHVTRTLQNAVVEKRVAHAFLFSGPRGTGKTSTARLLAKTLNCASGGPEPDSTCDSCIEISQGISLDVVEIDAASHGSVDDARDLREKVAYASVGGRWKVYIIDECHMLSPAANNALLKVLEEPPEHVVFIFATTEPHKVLQTLLDRCQRYEFRAIGANDVAELVAKVSKGEGIEMDEDAISLIGARAGGSGRDALTLLEQLASFAGNKIGLDDVARLLGSVPEDILFEVTDLISERDAAAVFSFSDRLVRSGSDIREFVRALVDHLRGLFLLLNATAPEEILEVTDEQLERLRAQANRFDSTEVLRLIDLASEIHVQLRQAADARLSLEVGLARMARPELHATQASLLSRIERLERLAGIGDTGEGVAPQAARPPAPAPSKPQGAAERKAPKVTPAPPAEPQQRRGSASRPVPATPVKNVAQVKTAPRAVSAPAPEETGDLPVEEPAFTGEIDIEKISRAWPIILEKVKRRKISFQALLLPASPVSWSGNELVLEFGPRSRFHKDKVAEPAQHAPLVEAFEEVFGVRPAIKCVLGEEASSASAPIDEAAATEGSETVDSDDGDDAVSALLKSFPEAEVVEES